MSDKIKVFHRKWNKLQSMELQDQNGNSVSVDDAIQFVRAHLDNYRGSVLVLAYSKKD